MKSIVLSMKPRKIYNIGKYKANNFIGCTPPKELPVKVYIYCQEIKDNKGYTDEIDVPFNTCQWCGNGKVVGEFICNEVVKQDYCGTEAYFWKVENLKIYDEPNELKNYKKVCKHWYDGERCEENCEYIKNMKEYIGYAPRSEYYDDDMPCEALGGMKPIDIPRKWVYIDFIEE